MIDPATDIKILTAVLAIVNPLGAIPMFISMTTNETTKQRYRTARIAAISVALILVSACLIGEPLLTSFGVSIPAFRVGGGLLVLSVAMSMMNAQPSRTRQTDEEAAEAEEKASVAVVPLAIPLLAGPGAISTMIIYAHNAVDWLDTGVLLGCSLAVALAIWLALRLAVPISSYVGTTGINIATRVMGLLLTAIAVEFIAGGLLELFPGLSVRGAPPLPTLRQGI
jgi:multiple antibiotic resistance protein